MATFFESLLRMFKGEPVFNPNDGKEPLSQGKPPEHLVEQSQQQAEQTATKGPKLLPQVMIERWQVVEEGGGLHAEFLIKNYSKVPVVLQRIELLGTRDELGRQLDPGEEYEYVFEMHQRPKDQSVRECRVYFKGEYEGDYFCSVHNVEFEKLPDNTYNILRFRFVPPIRDV